MKDCADVALEAMRQCDALCSEVKLVQARAHVINVTSWYFFVAPIYCFPTVVEK